MNFWTLVIRSLRYRFRAHLGAILGAAVGSAALIGALVVGDSVRGSLREKALERVGRVDYALAPPDRFFSDATAGWKQVFGTNCTTALQVPAVVTARNAAARANGVRVFGVTPDLGQLAPEPAAVAIDAKSALLNEALASHLGVAAGDEVLLRLHKPSALSRETPITPVSEASVALRLRVQGTLPPRHLGNFNRAATQIPAMNVFVRLDELQHATGLTNRANLLLVERAPKENGRSGELAALAGKLRQHWTLRDAELQLDLLDNAKEIELHSTRIFLDPAVAQAAQSLGSAADASATPGAVVRPILTYLVNQIGFGTNFTPYSMVTAAGAPWTPTDLRKDEILINQWLAEDLKLRPGDPIDLVYFLPESGVRLLEATNRFRVREIVPLAGVYADRRLMPEFPGVARAESTHDWDAGFPLVHKIRDQDEAYWKKHRGTPKAFISLAAGEALWANRFGTLTALRFPIPAGAQPTQYRQELEKSLLSRLDPRDLGLQFEPVRAQALHAASQAQDFGQLFLGFSFFLIVAALLLMALLFQFSLEQRAVEIGTLLAVGFTPRQVRRLLWAEGTFLALLGGLAGTLAGLGYARLLLAGLGTLWRQAVGGAGLSFHATPESIALGLVASTLIGAGTIWLVLRQQARRPARELLNGGGELPAASQRSARRGRGAWIGGAGLAGAAAIIGWAMQGGEASASGAFFGAGTLLLIAGLGFAAAGLAYLARVQAGADLTLTRLGVRGVTRRSRRSLAVAGLLACGCFLIIAIGAFKLDARQHAGRRDAGTGGFALIGEATLPVIRDLNSREGREFYALDESLLSEVSFVPMRVQEGDEASCLNLNRAQKPRLLGVDPSLLERRRAFTFAKTMPGLPPNAGWALLRQDLGANEIPALADLNSILWAMGKRVGDTIEYVDERGQPFKARLVGGLANSILQGSLLIDEAAFRARFPGGSGYRLFLIDAPSNSVAEVSGSLTRALQDVGLELTPAVSRLAALNAVQNTYLNTFQVLGGIGLLLGSAGLGVVVLRNVLERRQELAVLQAVGFRRRALRWLVLSEHALLVILGLGLGAVAALAAIWPAWRDPGAELPTGSLALTLAGILASGLIWTWLAARLALRGRLLEALRSE